MSKLKDDDELSGDPQRKVRFREFWTPCVSRYEEKRGRSPRQQSERHIGKNARRGAGGDDINASAWCMARSGIRAGKWLCDAALSYEDQGWTIPKTYRGRRRFRQSRVG